jgi:TetR/AcrR family transcriptional regulator
MTEKSTRHSSRRRKPGRPPDSGEQDARTLLIQAAAPLFAERGVAATSLRAVALRAGVTPAMVAYYFQDKAGLFEAVVRTGLTRVLTAMRELVDSDSDAEFVPRLIRTYLGVLSADPWIPQILIREVVSRDTPLRRMFQEEFAAKAVELIAPRIQLEISAGRLRRDLEPRFVLLSVVGMCLFPFVAQPVLGPLLNLHLDGDFGEQFADHTARLLLAGVRVPGDDS